jgi:mono/diheme cytochrome c family protein
VAQNAEVISFMVLSKESCPMKRMFVVITVLLLSLAACGDSVVEKLTPSPTAAEVPVVGEKVAGEAVLLFPTSTEAKDAPVKMVETAAPTATPAGDPLAGGKIFVRACAACHGQDMTQNEFIATRTDRELVEFIAVGGVPDGPLVMPPRGGNPTLTNENLVDIVAYLRFLQK